MKQYVTAVLASAGLMLGGLSLYAGPDDTMQSQSTQLPVQTAPGRQYDRDRLPNAATGNTIDEAAGADEQTEAAEASGMKAKAADPAAFVREAAEGDQAEIRLGELAQEKSSNAGVKSLAQHLVQDHQAHFAKVQQLAQQKNIQVSNDLSLKCQKKVDALSALNGEKFDKRYVHDMIRDHKKNIAFYQQAAANNSDPDVKTLAQSTLPTLQEHLQMAERDVHGINEPAGASTSQYQNNGQQK